MKQVQIFIFLFLISITSFSQINEFKNEITFYNTYRTGSIDSLKVNAENHRKLMKRINDSFRSFVIKKDIERADSFKTDWSNSNNKFLNLENVAEISIHTFQLDNKVFDVYAYTSFIAENYFIKDRDANVVVKEGDGDLYLVDTMHLIDVDHILLIEKFGDLNKSKKATVLKRGKKWIATKGFLATSFNEDKPEPRMYFKLYCSFEATLSAPRDVNNIYYTPSTKTLFYRKYNNDGKFKVIKSEWTNKRFIIDDVDAGENLDTYSVPAPEG